MLVLRNCAGRSYVGVLIAIAIALGAAITAGMWLPRRSSSVVLEKPSVTPVAQQEYEGLDLMLRLYFKPLPTAMPGSENDTPELVALGRKLYFEPGMSLTKSQSCSTCHKLDAKHAGADAQPTSKGVKGTRGTRNSPTVLNAGFQMMQFWDGRSVDLAEQAKGPLLNPIEMAMRTRGDVEQRLRNNQAYVSAFKKAFPKQSQPVTFDNVAEAIAAFERTLVSPARFDRFLRGEKSALTPAEQNGMQHFIHLGCVECHSSTPLGGRTMQVSGVHHPYPHQKDLGRFDVTRDPADKYVFKAPMLRNVALTPPYFHDGKVKDLKEAIRLMGWMQLDRKLTRTEIEQVEGFLHTLNSETPIIVTAP